MYIFIKNIIFISEMQANNYVINTHVPNEGLPTNYKKLI